ncbi:unnamed protein product [Hanseniaspora opuntiae]
MFDLDKIFSLYYPPTDDAKETKTTPEGSHSTDRLIPESVNAGENDDPVLDEPKTDQLYGVLKRKIIFGAMAGLFVCFIIGLVIISIFYTLGHDLWQQNEHIFEALMSIFAAIVISFMSVIFLRIGKLQDKIRMKMAGSIYQLSKNSINNLKVHAIFFLPFITSLREGLEAVVFLGGVGVDSPVSSLPLSMLLAGLISFFIGRFFYKSSTSFSLRICLIIASTLLYILASGLMSKGVWQIDLQRYVNKCDGQDMTELGNGPGSYDIVDSVWHVNWGGEKDGFWVILTALFGWTNSATYGSVISYNLFWLAIICMFKSMHIIERKGYLPFVPIFLQRKQIEKRIQFLKHKLKVNEFDDEGIQQPLLVQQAK